MKIGERFHGLTARFRWACVYDYDDGLRHGMCRGEY